MAFSSPVDHEGLLSSLHDALPLSDAGQGGHVSSGSYSVPATLSFTGGTHDLAAGSSVTGTGSAGFHGATLNALGAYSPTKTELVSGTANFESAAQTTQLAQSGGTM